MNLKSSENRQKHVVRKDSTGGLFFSTFQKGPLFEIREKDGEILLMKRGRILAYTFLLVNRLFLPVLSVFAFFAHFRVIIWGWYSKVVEKYAYFNLGVPKRVSKRGQKGVKKGSKRGQKGVKRDRLADFRVLIWTNIRKMAVLTPF